MHGIERVKSAICGGRRVRLEAEIIERNGEHLPYRRLVIYYQDSSHLSPRKH
jgi:hypothetical protein